MSDRDGGWTLITFLAGVVVGAGVALILAPESGEETRKKLKDVAGKAGEYAAKKAKETLEKKVEDKEEKEEKEEEE